LQPGDLVLLKGSSHTDGLSRIVSAWTKKAQGRSGDVRPAPDYAATPTIATNVHTGSADAAVMDKGVGQLVVGLGNPGKRFEQTPHNVGQRTLDVLAESLHANWSEEDSGLVARAEVQGQPVLLVKPATEMNSTGPWIRQVAEQGKLKAQDCVIIHDDIHLPPGVVRNRMSGSSGGHKGVQSIIAAFQSEDIRRVKIGVGLPTGGIPVTRYVLTPFETSQRDTIENACHQAATRVLEMLKLHALST
jgi:PTH1 family peptidyl-tRNA hydrolase